MSRPRLGPHDEFFKLRTRMLNWLVQDAFPLWARFGVDRSTGGFVEALDADGNPLALPRRLRIQPRQAFSFAQARQLGWKADASALITSALEFAEQHHRRSDGMYRTLVDARGDVLDDTPRLYDHAFLLLGFASAAIALDAVTVFETKALEMLSLLERRWWVGDGFLSADSPIDIREANPHMHLLEAFLAWYEIGSDPCWEQWVERIAQLAAFRLLGAERFIRETYDAAWQPAAGVTGRIVEPGHQFEWAWLLMRCLGRDAERYRETALKLIQLGERLGTRQGVAINGILDDGRIHNANARLWPQTERIKALLGAYRSTGHEHFLHAATRAGLSLLPYLDTDIAGLWHDELLPSGEFTIVPVFTSTFYHLVGVVASIEEIGRDIELSS